MNTADNFGYASRANSQDQGDLSSATGVSILGFKSESTAREAGMQTGDIIVEYDGMRNLTTDKLMALTTVTRPEGTQIRMAFMRNGHERSALVPPGPLGISVLDTTMHTSSGQDASDELTERFKRLGLGTLWAYLVLGLLTFGAAALGFLVIGSWDNLVILLFMLLVPAMVLGFLYYLIWSLLFFPTPQYYAVSLLFFGWVAVTLELIRRAQDSLLILGLAILFFVGFFVLLGCSTQFIPSLRTEKGTVFGIGIGMLAGFGISYGLWGQTWDWSLFLATACAAIGAYVGRKMVDKNTKQ